MDEQYRRIIAIYVLELIKLSENSNPRAAAIFRGYKLITSSYSKKIGVGYNNSPVVDSYLELLRTILFLEDESDLNIMCSYFPTLEEFIFLCHTKIRTIYYAGEISDEKTVRFLNRLSMENPKDGFETIKINFK